MELFIRCVAIFIASLIFWPLAWFFVAFFITLDILERRAVNSAAKALRPHLLRTLRRD